MRIRILGAHNLEAHYFKYVSFLIDDVLAVEAGALTSSLSFPEQQKLKAVLLTHQHYDHIKDIPALGMNFWMHGNNVELLSTRAVYDTLAANMLNDELYPNFMEKPPGKPAFVFRVLEPNEIDTVAGFSVQAVPVSHSVPAVGYQITSADGAAVFYTSDTGPGLADCWRQISPRLLLIEVTTPNRNEDFARRARHLTPGLLQTELVSFRELKGYLPRIVLVHMNPLEEKEIAAEIALVANSLNTTIQLGYEGMQINV